MGGPRGLEEGVGRELAGGRRESEGGAREWGENEVARRGG